MNVYAKVVEKGLGLMKMILAPMLDPETKERLYKQSLTSSKRKALEIAEQHLLSITRRDGFLHFVNTNIKLNGNKIVKRAYDKWIKEIEETYDKFFKYNN